MQLQNRYIAAKRALFDRAYGNLNSKQREAVYNVNGPLLILAGAGSGKTTVLVKRISHIIKFGTAYTSERIPEGLTEEHVLYYEKALALDPSEIESNILPDFIENPCPPYRMLAITFTNKAANEIKNRLANAFDDPNITNDIWAGTFHSICMRILRRYSDRLGYAPGFSIYDTDDTKRAVASAMKKCNISDKQFPIKNIQNEISRAKDKLMSPEDFEAEAGSDYRLSMIARVYKEYQRALKESNAMDFDDIIMQTVTLFRNDREVLDQWQNRFTYICVDEYQDTNRAQFVLTSLLGGGFENIMVVGDDDQSIYKFRGATVQNILGFDKNYKNVKIIKLEQNYRSTQNILDAANSVIANNLGRKGKTLWTAGDKGEKIRLHCAYDQNDEARYITGIIGKGVANQERHYRDYAVLYRTNSQSRELETALTKAGVPYRMLCGVRFTDRKEIRDVTAYLQLICNNGDRERFLRIINEPKRKIGDKSLEALSEIADMEGKTLFEIAETADKYVALSRSAPAFLAFAELIHKLTEAAHTMPLPDLFDYVLEESGYRQMLEDAGESEQERLDNIDEFKSSIMEYADSAEEPTLYGFLEENALVADVDRFDENADAVVMMTIHSAKGLEFPVVFLPGMEDGIFPGMQTICGNPEDMEEERRLAYVALTRAKEQIFILHAHSRLFHGKTAVNPVSRFVTEIPDDLLLRDEPVKQSPAFRSYIVNGEVAGTAKKTNDISENRISGTKINQLTVFEPGDRVVHPIFGKGEVLSSKKMGADILYEIIFDNAGTKKLMATYARLKREN